MNETNIGKEGSDKPIEPTQVVSFEMFGGQTNSNQFFTSTLAPSGQETLSIQYDTANPILETPQEFANSVQTQMAEISIKSLKAWSDAIEEQATLVKKLINSPEYLAREEELRKLASGATKELNTEINGDNLAITKAREIGGLDFAEKYAWLQALGVVSTSIVEIKEMEMARGVVGATGVANVVGALGIQNGLGVQDAQGNITGVRPVASDLEQIKVENLNTQITGATKVDEIEKGGFSQFFAHSFLLAVSEVGFMVAGAPAAALGASRALHSEAIVIKNAWSSLTRQSSNPSGLLAGWVSALWGIGLIYQTSAEKIKGYDFGKKTNTEIKDVGFAKTYAEKILGLVNSPEFIQSMQLSMAKSDPGADVGSLIAKSKLVLLSTTLALLVKTEVGGQKNAGWINELDFAGLLNGKTDVAMNDLYNTASLKRALIGEINGLLSHLSVRERGELMYNLLSYMSSNPAVEDLLDQQVAFEEVLHHPSFENEVLSKRPID